MAWQGEICKRCGARNCIGFTVPDAVWSSVSRGRWNVLCTSCFDFEAEIARVPYSFSDVWPVSWSSWANESPVELKPNGAIAEGANLCG